jgi:hypothetical protein
MPDRPVFGQLISQAFRIHPIGYGQIPTGTVYSFLDISLSDAATWSLNCGVRSLSDCH